MNENNTATETVEINAAKTVEIKTAEPKAKLTPAEKRAKCAAYAREYYKKHTAERIAAAKKCRAAKKARIAAEKTASEQNAAADVKSETPVSAAA